MALSTLQTTDVSQALAELIDGVPNLRTYWYVSDAVRPPAAVISQPTIDYTDSGSGFCYAAWLFPVTVIVARNNDRDAQLALSQLLFDITHALTAADVPGVFSIEPQDARPVPVQVGSQESPGYLLNVRVRA